jgi:tetratricopeptide (TPR) repeat protein
MGCSESPSRKVVTDHIAEGWSLFEQGDYAGAVEEFQVGVADDKYEAYNGLGWSYAKLDQLSDALTSFNAAISASTAEPDPYAGRAPVYRDLDPPRFDEAKNTAQKALAKDAQYEFEHLAAFDWRDLRIIMAQSYYSIGDLDSAKVMVDALDGKSLDPASDTFAEDLAEEIERLESLHGD